VNGVETVVFQLFIGQRLIGRHKKQTRVDVNAARQFFKATLAPQDQFAAPCNVQEELFTRCAALDLTGHDKADWLRARGAQNIGQTRQLDCIDLTLQLRAAAGKLERIGNPVRRLVSLVRHKRQMVLFLANSVKARRSSTNAWMRTAREYAMTASSLHLVLASTSRYRRELLERFGLPFVTARPDVDETPHPGEHPARTAERLALEKARAVAAQFPNALIIGSDQVAYRGDERFEKPGTAPKAIEQLARMSGGTIVFHTALCLLNTRTNTHQIEAVPIEARFRMLSHDEIVRYVDREQPLDVAGSAKSEGLGISLLDYMRGDDPNALVGLPLIALARMLRAEGVQVP
jgi:septum formation protein